MDKGVFAAIAFGLTIAALWPYIRSIRAGRSRPHVFSWVIWGSATFVVFLAQLAGGAGVGAWPIGFSAILSLYIALLAYARRGEIRITRSDWLFFGGAMLSLPAWALTSDPLWAVVILTTVDALGFGPTYRKTFADPTGEPIWLFILMGTRNLVVIFALEAYNLTTVLFPGVTVGLCAGFVLVTLWRRRVVARASV